MLGREAEERAEPEELLLDARGGVGRRLRDRAPDAVVEVEDELVEDLLLSAEVEVEGALADPAASVILTIEASW